MVRGNNRSRGFTLIAALLILILLSGVAVGLMFMVTNEVKMGGNDLQANVAYYGAESGMEKLTTDLAALYQSTMSPRNCDIYNLANTAANWPTTGMVGNLTYSETVTGYAPAASLSDCASKPTTTWDTVSSGSNQGLVAELVPMTLTVTASRPGGSTGTASSGATVTITRNIEVALVPVFQFGVFCGFDCSYFAGPNFSFGGRVHTNGNLFLASGGSNLVFNDKVQAYKQIIMDQLENGWGTPTNYAGTVYVPKAAGGCPLNQFPPVGANCIQLPGVNTVPGDASWSGGYPTIAGSANANFPSISSASFNYYLANSKTGVTNMQLPFVNTPCTTNPPPCTDPIAIIRKPIANESNTGPIGSTRLYNKAEIRVLLADSQADLHPDWAGTDASDVQLPNTTTYNGGPFSLGAVTLSAASGHSGQTEYLGWGKVGQNGWVAPFIDAGQMNWVATTPFPLLPSYTTLTATTQAPSAMTGPWIRVEYCTTAPCNAHADFVGVTQEWLNLGFSRLFNTVPTTPGGNTVDPNAIIILQQLNPWVAQSAASAHGAGTQYNFFPINLYDAREGEMRDNPVLNQTNGNVQLSSCSVNGIMNAVEIDVGNLAKWLNGTIAGSGTAVNYNAENGYVLYFSDHRGMLSDPNPSNGGNTPAGVISGESGIEDVVNSAQIFTSTTPDGAKEAATYYTYSPEDVDQNGFLDNWGEKNIGYGFDINTNTNPLNPYQRINVANKGLATQTDCAAYNTGTSTYPNAAKDQMGLANPVSGARHVLKLIDGGMNAAGTASYLPVMPAASGCVNSAANPTACGGFTLASENPVYVQGNYNSNAADPFWGTANNATPTQTPHSAASIVADSVMLLSNQWSDAASLLYPNQPASRNPTASGYYRMAVSGGKNVPFPQPNWANAAQDLGTDGGMHNFLRYLETWGALANPNGLFYNGSLVSMYYAEYNTGIYKDGGGPNGSGVYSPPPRKYYFDVLFLNPNNLPPATPEFQDIDNLSYHQNFTPN